MIASLKSNIRHSTFNIIASLSLFTRLPIWRWVEVPQRHYESAVVYWPLVGWLTGGLAALIMCIPPTGWSAPIVVTIALTARLLLTGALHEDGLADFCDGFGGGGDKQRILTIMKDSHIGTYGVIGLILYFILSIHTLSAFPLHTAALVILASDPFAKLCASQLTNILPYARPEGAKNKISYSRMTAEQILWQIVFGVTPLMLLAHQLGTVIYFAMIAPVTVVTLLMLLMHRRIGGYTGDCCGATYLICELAMLLGIYSIYLETI